MKRIIKNNKTKINPCKIIPPLVGVSFVKVENNLFVRLNVTGLNSKNKSTVPIKTSNNMFVVVHFFCFSFNRLSLR
jgi:hypothetical protein